MDINEIALIYGSDGFEMTKSLLQYSRCDAGLNKDAHIVLKPNLVVAQSADTGATTHPEIVTAVVDYFYNRGFRNISIAESSWIGDCTQRAFKVHRYDKLVSDYKVSLVDIKKDEYETVNIDKFYIEYSKTVLEADFLINLPVLKGHCQTKITCALKNLKGCISDRSKRNFHSWGLHKPIAVLNTIRKGDLVIVDSLNGDLDFEEGGNPVETNRMFCGLDSVLIDSFGCSLLGYETEEIPYIGYAETLGVGSSNLNTAKIVELNQDATNSTFKPSQRIKSLEKHVKSDSACSACYGNLIHALARLEEKNLLSDLRRVVNIGQGFKGSIACGLGVGNCTNGFSHTVAGCPPKAIDMLKFLERMVD